MRDLIILGGGPAGCTAGIYAARKKLDTLLIAKDFTGQVGWSSWVENYPGFKKISGLNLAKEFLDHLKDFDIDIKSFQEATDIKKKANGFSITTDEGEYESKAIIIATGAIPKELGVPNEDKFLGKGISYCVTCDAMSFEGERVAVIGGGNAGVEAAIELARFAKKVYLIEILEAITADELLIEEVYANKKIEVLTSVHVEGFEGTDELEEIMYLKKDTGKKENISVDGCFVEIGTLPNTKFVKDFVKLNEKEEIIVDPKTFQTSVKGVFAAGDVVDFKEKQIVIATGQGALASLNASRYLHSLK
jgi:NADH-dependent peroxiredoxin subunit F